MSQESFIEVKISEKATGRIITSIDDEYPDCPYEVCDGAGGIKNISSEGYVTVCRWRSLESVTRMLWYLLYDLKGAWHTDSDDVILTAEELRRIYVELLRRGAIRENRVSVFDEETEEEIPCKPLIEGYKYDAYDGDTDSRYENRILVDAKRIHDILWIAEEGAGEHVFRNFPRTPVPDWLSEQIPDKADAEMLSKEPWRFGFDFMFANSY